ncbi:MAG: AmmeMemoRadiSam system protein A [Candidatus Neomarinimicrobiota bacterium]
MNSPSFAVTNQQKIELLRLARNSIKEYLIGGRSLPEAHSAIPPDVRCGAFVTLRNKGQLRGCIGHLADDLSLAEVVGKMALEAAVRDWRFKAVSLPELSKIEIEISVLSPIRPIGKWQDIIIGRDGILLRKEGRSAVFLPQVAIEQGWSLQQTLDQLCRKAGLPPEGWRENARLFTFQADIFSDADFPDSQRSHFA